MRRMRRAAATHKASRCRGGRRSSCEGRSIELIPNAADHLTHRARRKCVKNATDNNSEIKRFDYLKVSPVNAMSCQNNAPACQEVSNHIAITALGFEPERHGGCQGRKAMRVPVSVSGARRTNARQDRHSVTGDATSRCATSRGLARRRRAPLQCDQKGRDLARFLYYKSVLISNRYNNKLEHYTNMPRTREGASRRWGARACPSDSQWDRASRIRAPPHLFHLKKMPALLRMWLRLWANCDCWWSRTLFIAENRKSAPQPRPAVRPAPRSAGRGLTSAPRKSLAKPRVGGCPQVSPPIDNP